MREKFPIDGDTAELILTDQSGDLLRAPLGSLMAMTTLNDGELFRFHHQPPAPEPGAPLPPRRHVRVTVEEIPPPTLAHRTAPPLPDGPSARLISADPHGPVSRHLAAAPTPAGPWPTGTPVREEY